MLPSTYTAIDSASKNQPSKLIVKNPVMRPDFTFLPL